MRKKMTVVEAIKKVLSDVSSGMTYKQIYRDIIDQKLYEFGAKVPENIVRGEIRRHCIDSDFPTSSPNKCFRIDHQKDGELYYALLNDESEHVSDKEQLNLFDFYLKSEKELLPEERIVQAS